ncbi:hypothetical protein IGS68_00985 [Skermanella sp. TT6]|uniref:Uncharacterized protein n=1 Tax=Skermanella cutis TaxID=2775420 RepID=A0ABX7B6B5_9PROT|nr:hypothetical protein [Skermanella sp. TT6]QQP89886.1 hypothetical protein IGS68_00985 [Skermanella sp. TT6]
MSTNKYAYVRPANLMHDVPESTFLSFVMMQILNYGGGSCMEMTMNGIDSTGSFDTSIGSPIARGNGVAPPAGRRGERIAAVSEQTVRSAHEVRVAGEEAIDTARTAPRVPAA